MNNKLISLAMVLTVGVILTATLLVPAINDASKIYTETYTNGPASNSISLATYSINADFEINMEKSGDVWNIDGIDVNSLTTGSYILTDNLLLILSTVNGFAIRGINESQAYVNLTSADWNGTTSEVTALKITVTPESITVADADSVQTSYTFPNEYIVYSKNDGERVICTAHQDLYTAGGKDVISVGTNVDKFFWCTNGDDSKSVYNATLLDTSINCPLTEVSEDVDKISVGVGGTYTVSVTYNNTVYDLAPQYVSVPLSLVQGSEANSQITPLLGVIPILVIVGLLLVAIRGAIVRNN